MGSRPMVAPLTLPIMIWGRRPVRLILIAGTITFTYDPNGSPIEEVDARGSAEHYAGYDGLNRPLWRNSTNSASGAW